MKLIMTWFTICSLGLFVLSGCSDSAMCDNDIIRELTAPDGKQKVVLYTRNCGATTSTSTHVSLLASDETLSNEYGNLFHAGSGEVWLRWLGPNQLKIAYEKSAEPSFQVQKFGGLSITYEER